jgi:ubiquinone/menaquinone biosynthesis C-methylase UbiE
MSILRLEVRGSVLLRIRAEENAIDFVRKWSIQALEREHRALESDPYHSLRKEYAELASRYDRRWEHYVNASIDRTLAELDLAPGEVLLDIGCGTGVLLERVAQRQPRARLYGSDLSGAMLAMARSRLASPIQLLQANAEALPMASASIDVLVSTSAFHFIRHPARAMSEIRRVLRPGGRLIITDWCRDFLTGRLLDWYLKAYDNAHYHTYGSTEFARLLDDNDFDSISLSRYRINWFWGLFTATAIRANSPGAHAARPPRPAPASPRP